MPRYLLLELTNRELALIVESGRKCYTDVAAGADPNTWTPDEEPSDEAGRAAYEADARAACSGCLVRWECLERALRLPEPEHIHGGMAPWQRDRIAELFEQASPEQRERVASLAKDSMSSLPVSDPAPVGRA